MSLELLKFLTEGGAIALSVAANILAARWILKTQQRSNEIMDARLEEAKTYAAALADARVDLVNHNAETARTIASVTSLISNVQASREGT